MQFLERPTYALHLELVGSFVIVDLKDSMRASDCCGMKIIAKPFPFILVEVNK